MVLMIYSGLDGAARPAGFGPDKVHVTAIGPLAVNRHEGAAVGGGRANLSGQELNFMVKVD